MKNFINNLISLTLFAAVVASSCTSSDYTRFATTDMTWAEFYSGEFGISAAELEANGYDAVTSATMSKSKRFSGHIVSEDGSKITGVRNVAVCMTEAVYNSLSDTDRARFTFYEDTTFAGYKVLDRNGNFSEYHTETVPVSGVSARVSSGSSSSWGNYTVGFSGLKLEGAWHGVVLTADDGSQYGLMALDNVWLNSSELGISVAEFVEPHGNKPLYKHTASLEGKTIKNVKYIMSGAPAVSIDTDILLKKICRAAVSVENPRAGKDLTFTISGLPSGYRVASARKGKGRGAEILSPDQFRFDESGLTIYGDVAGTYSITFQHNDWSDLTATFTAE